MRISLIFAIGTNVTKIKKNNPFSVEYSFTLTFVLSENYILYFSILREITYNIHGSPGRHCKNLKLIKTINYYIIMFRSSKNYILCNKGYLRRR